MVGHWEVKLLSGYFPSGLLDGRPLGKRYTYVHASNRKQALCFTGNNKHTMHTTRQSIPTFPVVADGLKNAELSNKVQLELFDAQVHFLSLAAVWRTNQILENRKQDSKSTRRTRRANAVLPSFDTARSAVSRAKRGLMREAHPSEARNPSLARAANES